MNAMGATQNNLRTIRKSQKLSMAAVYVTCGVSTNTISMIELYGLFPGADVRERLAAMLNVEQSDIWPHLAEPVGVC